ncbi:Protein ROT1 [Nakaseomyces bracarensis]|uniref:Protein ROT1 n=1 Tax=Nakaseomyces bracarensis TaxID=273131 RepID=A0ABR4NXA1_9SACH
MRRSLVYSLLVAVVAGDASELVGTWSSKSNQVFTGPGFYDPIDELLIEPALPGISYSFTEDGWFEEATYQVSGNPRDPTCPKASLIFQHGTYELLDNGTLILNPIEVDGRQLFSDPCSDNGISTYTRYNQTETFKSWEMGVDPYHGIYRLQLYQFDGSPLPPLYLAYKPPMMLPTETLNPTDSSNAKATASSDDTSKNVNLKKRSVREHVRRSLENRYKTNAVKQTNSVLNSNFFWYVSAALVGTGSIIFLTT